MTIHHHSCFKRISAWRSCVVLALAALLPLSLLTISKSAGAITPDPKRGGTVTLSTFGERYNLQAASSSNMTWDKDPLHPGRPAFKLRLYEDDARVAGGLRTEISPKNEYTVEGVRWYAMSFMLPSDWEFNNYITVLAQLHTSQKTAVLPPPVSVIAEGDQLKLELRSSTLPVEGLGAVTKDKVDARTIRLGTLETNKWYCFVIKADWSWRPGKGSLDIWLNGNRAYNANNLPNAYTTWLGNYPKVGLYAPGGVLGTRVRELYTDFVWLGDDKSSLAQMQRLTPCSN